MAPDSLALIQTSFLESSPSQVDHKRGSMSSRARKTSRLTKRDSSDSTKHTRNSNEYSSIRGTGDPSNEDTPTSTIDGDFSATGIKEFLDYDPRPTFVVDQNTNLTLDLSRYIPMYLSGSIFS